MAPVHESSDWPRRPHSLAFEAKRRGTRVRTDDDPVEPGRQADGLRVNGEPHVGHKRAGLGRKLEYLVDR